ncbi:MAG TPA: RHS repeat-associated core domain-containing protein [Candidatus Limnocylindrales bacterium]
MKRTAFFAVGVLLCTLAYAPPASAAPYKPGKPQEEPKVFGYTAVPSGLPQQSTGRPFQASEPTWPAESTVDVALPYARSRKPSDEGAVKAEGLPVTIESSAIAQARVQAFGRARTEAAGVQGVLLRVGRVDGVAATGPAEITVDYNAFRWAYGGDWAARLRLVAYPECALTTPTGPLCQGEALPSRNDVKAGKVSARVEVLGQSTVATPAHGRTASDEPAANTVTGGTLIGITAAPAGSTGDYKATSLSPSATWSAGNNSGDFSWSYPLRMPPALGGPAPSIALNYSSSSVDGRMASANNQPSIIGEGFEWHPGYIERRYNACAEDMGSGANNTTKTGDQCWETDNASLNLAGHAGELLKDPNDGNRWHLRNDDGTRVERKTGAGNGDNNGEWFLVTTTDGTQYWFGGRPGSESTLVSTVYGNHSGEQCHLSSFAASHCNQGYRWQLDHVVDRHGNTMSLTYAKEKNKYGKNNSTTDLVEYDRAGNIVKIEYGTRTGSAGNAPMVVEFTMAERCLTNCTDKKNYFDVPTDQECTASPCDDHSPSFYTKRRLSTVKTRVLGTSGYRDVEQWTLTHSFPDPTDSITPALWLEKISHTGLVGGGDSVPDISFAGQYLPNRVDTAGDQYPAMNRFRIRTITSESGGKIDLTYSSQDCVAGSRVPDKNNLHTNNLRCYPVKWIPPGHTNPIDDFFHKYLIRDVVEADIFGSSTRTLTHYDYLGDPAWHYTDDDGFVKKEYKTWSVWRGFGTVRTVKGDGTDGPQSVEERRYFRGMHGDKLPSGTRTVTMPAIALGNVPAVNDEDAFAGQARETIVLNGAAEVSASVVEPWQSNPTASRTINEHTVHARFGNNKVEHKRTTLDGGRPARLTKKVSEFDEYGMPTKVDNFGDTAKPDDQECTLIDYARNTASSVWILDKTSRERRYAVDCTKVAAGGLTADDVLDDTLTAYDGLAFGAAPTRGLVTRVDAIKAFSGGVPTYITTSRTTYDDHGRTKEAWDIRGGRTLTEYTPAIGGPLTNTKETNPLGWTKKSTNEPAWGLPKVQEDTNGRLTAFAYDPMGRLTKVWLPGRSDALPASIVFEYHIRNNAHTVVKTRRLNAAGGYIDSYKLYDSLLRNRQTQDPNHTGGAAAVVTDVFYDSAGRAFKTFDQYTAFNSAGQPVAPGLNIFNVTSNIPSFKLRQYDGAAREIAEITMVDGPPGSPGGTEKWRTTTVYGGDRTHVTPPQGGSAQTTVLDADGSVAEMRNYHAGVPAGSASGFDKTTYVYNRKGKLEKVTDPTGLVWEYKYNLRGNVIEAKDPDKGTSTTEYNDFGDIRWSKDANGVTLAYTYDAIGRKETLRDGSETGPLRAKWFYDTLSNGTPVKGQLVKTIRYDGTDEYIKEHTGYTIDYQPTNVRYTIADPDLRGSTGTYTYTYTYNQDGSTATTRLPGMGDLATEQLTHGYNALGKATTLDTSIGATAYVSNLIDNTPGTQYTAFGELAAIHLRHNSGSMLDILKTYNTQTRRLEQIWTTRQTAPTAVSDVRFGYDPMGNVTKISDVTSGDYQCFKTDAERRLEEAWTPAGGDCNAARSVAALGGPAKYWHSYRYDPSGNRRQLIENYTPTGGSRTTDYAINAGTHRLGATSVGGAQTGAYTYDAAGNLKSRPTPGAGTQSLDWDPEGHLAKSVDSTGTTTYIYDVDGNRLVRKDPAGKTLYLPGQELRFTTAGGTKKCTRYYTHAGETIAMRTSAGITWIGNDHHGTAHRTINAVGQAIATRWETPFGAQRGSSGTWPAAMDKGFVGGTKDNTGLTHLGAREYDPLIGRFISVDSVIDNKDPQQMNGYNYANNSPITGSDPDGLWPKWMDNAGKAMEKAVTAVKATATAVANTNPVLKGIHAASNWVANNAGTISAVLGVAAVVCMIPPLTVAAPFLGAASAAFGAIDTAKSCMEGAGLDCGLGIAGMIPGARALTGIGKAAKAIGDAKDAKKALDAATDAKMQYDVGTEVGTIARNGPINKGLKHDVRVARNNYEEARDFRNSGRWDDSYGWWDAAGHASLTENVLWEFVFENDKNGRGSRHEALGFKPYCNCRKPPKKTTTSSSSPTPRSTSSYMERKMAGLEFI